MDKPFPIKLSSLFILLMLVLTGCQAQLQRLDDRLGEMIAELEGWSQEEGGEEAEATSTPPNISELNRWHEKKIDQWLQNNGYNRYGDALDTMYSGGTPLFDEETGKKIERFEYILRQHPGILDKIEQE